MHRVIGLFLFWTRWDLVDTDTGDTVHQGLRWCGACSVQDIRNGGNGRRYRLRRSRATVAAVR